MKRRIRTLVVDDSAFARKVIRESLSASPEIEIVGFATDGLDALEKIVQLAPDVVTMDLVMPELDGVGVLRTLRSMPKPPRVVIVTAEDADATVAVAALQEGAFDVVLKPTKLASDRLYDIGSDLLAKVLLAGGMAMPLPTVRTPVPRSPKRKSNTRVIVIGASTGGPRAVTEVLRGLSRDFPTPILVVVHMPVGYTASFATRLDRDLELSVHEAQDLAYVEPGGVAIGRAGKHMLAGTHPHGVALSLVERSGVEDLHTPSVDMLFRSAAAAFGSDVIAVVLTGMGNDGLAGARAIRDAGGYVLAESEETSVVYGMPRAVIEAGLAHEKLPLGAIAPALVSLVSDH